MRHFKLCIVMLLCGVFYRQAQAAPVELCSSALDQSAVIQCALVSSPEVRRARQELQALAERRVAADTWLPTYPVLEISSGKRRFSAAQLDAPAPVFNWSATLSQQIEIAGQRRRRLEGLDAEAAAQVRRVAVAEQEVAAQALSAYFELVAAQKGLELARSVGKIAKALGEMARARAKEALLSPVDADVVLAETLRLRLALAAAERRDAVAQARLKILLGLQIETPLTVADDLTPPVSSPSPDAEDVLVTQALLLRGEVAAAETEREVLEHRLSLLRRERIPNLTLSVFFGDDGYHERVVGGGVAFPLPLPSPVGPSRAGEIAEMNVRIQQSQTDLDRIRRQIRLEVTMALADKRSRALAVQLFTPELVERTAADLRVISEGLASGQLSMQAALAAQRSLIELLQTHVEARLAFVLACVELMRASGISFSGVSS